MQIYQVTQATVIRHSESPLRLLIQATGLAVTTGWANARLDNMSAPSPEDAILEFSFDADRPTGISLPVLTPINGSIVVEPTGGADAVVVQARINSITVHASEFQGAPGPAPVTNPLLPAENLTFAWGENTPTAPVGENLTTLRVGEEGWTNPHLDNPVSTLRVGEEGPTTNPLLDDPFGSTGGPFGNF